MKGLYIVFEGVVGSGKTTQSKLLLEKLKEKFPKREIIWTREPGGSEIADAIRKVVQGEKFSEEMNPICEQYLYAASRAQTIRQIIKPVLDVGGIVLSDRSFFTSIAYQGFGRGLVFSKVLEINRMALDGVWPDHVIFIDVDIDSALGRSSDKEGDKFESMDKDFFKKVRQGYLFAAKKYPKIVEKIDGNRGIEEIHGELLSKVLTWLK